MLKPCGIELYTANGKTINTFGLAEKIKFQLGCYELETNFVVVDDAKGVEDFLLGRNFLRTYQVLVDLTAMKVVVRARTGPVWYHAHTQVSNETLNSPKVLAQDVVLQPFERTILKAILVSNDLESFAFRNVLVNLATSNRILKNSLFLENNVANIGETGYLFVSVGNLTSNCQRVKRGTLFGTSVPVILVGEASPQSAYKHEPSSPPSTCKHETDCTNHVDFVCKIYGELNIDTSSNYTSSSEFEFLSSTDPSVDGPSERQIKKH